MEQTRQLVPLHVVSLCLTLLLGGAISAGCTRNSTANTQPETEAVAVEATTVEPAVEATEPVVASAETTEIAAERAAPTNDPPRPPGWSEETHSNHVDPNYAVVFPKNKVNHLLITIPPQNWEAMQADMTRLFGERGSWPLLREPGTDPGEEKPGITRVEKPIWVTATITFEGKTWTNVGVRFKGHSSLRNYWWGGSDKLPFKFDFDEFEDQHPEIHNQRFYGFKQLSLANNFSDNSFLRDTVTYDILEKAGLVAAETAFYQIHLDHGEGPRPLGLYTMIEVIDDTVVSRYFGSNDGNIYEADGPAASFAAGTAGEIPGSFQKENNEDEDDWSDIEALYTLLHSDLRTTDPEAWRASLEAIFDVETFLKWLAISAVIQHWDTYGARSQNYYLYHDPQSDRLVWISWDHNMAMSIRDAGQGRDAGQDDSLSKKSVGTGWPLIRYLLDDPTYFERYKGYLAETSSRLFKADQMAQTYQSLAALIRPYATAEIGKREFEKAIQELIHHAYARGYAVAAFLRTQ